MTLRMRFEPMKRPAYNCSTREEWVAYADDLERRIEAANRYIESIPETLKRDHRIAIAFLEDHDLLGEYDDFLASTATDAKGSSDD